MNCFYPYLLSFALLLAGCSGEEGPGGGDVAPVTPEKKVAVSFSSKLYLEPVTKADNNTGNLTTGAYVVIRAYKQDAQSGAPLVRQDYTVDANGDLTVVNNGEPMYLAAGKYTFYALSVNAASAPPELATGSNSETGALANNTDYLYCATEVTITSTPAAEQNISLSFVRLATRISLKINCGSGSDKATAAEAPTFAFPATDPSGMKISLGADPVIAAGTQVENKNTEVKSTGSVDEGFAASYIQLPLAGNLSIPVTITFPSITFGDLVQTNKVYTLTIPSANAGFVSGNQYNYNVNISGNEIYFGEVTVSSWKGVDGSFPDSGITEDF